MQESGGMQGGMQGVVKQRSMAWRRKRLGMVTASRFGDVLTQPRGKQDRAVGAMSATASAYLYECLAEWLTGIPLDRFRSRATDWGNEWEATAFVEARQAIAERYGYEVLLPEGDNAFLLHGTEDLIGCSPDGIAGEDGLLEIKCGYNPRTHLETVLDGWMPEKHKPQVQGSLWISGRSWYAFVSFDPRYQGSAIDPLFLVRVERDEEWIEGMLAPSILAFRDRLQSEYDRIMELYQKRVAMPF